MATGRIPINGTAAIQSTIVDAKGDIIAATGADAVSRLAVGANDTILVADSSTSTGLKWQAPAGGSFVGVKATKNTTQSIANATDTLLTFPTESYDTDGFHSTTTNTGRITIPTGKGGYYLIIAHLATAANATGTRQIYINKNGATLNGGFALSASSADAFQNGYSTIENLAAADYLEFYVYQTSGGSLNANNNTSFTVQYLGA